MVSGEGRGGTLIFSFISDHLLGVQNFEFQYLGGGGQQNEYFWGYDEIVDTFGGHKMDYLGGGSFLYTLGLFL